MASSRNITSAPRRRTATKPVWLVPPTDRRKQSPRGPTDRTDERREHQGNIDAELLSFLDHALPGQPRCSIDDLHDIIRPVRNFVQFTIERAWSSSSSSTYLARCILVGAPGLGKSHLVPALARFLNDAPDVWNGCPTDPYLLCIPAHELTGNHGRTLQKKIYEFFEQCEAEFRARPLPGGRFPTVVILVEEITRARGMTAMHDSFRDLLGGSGFEYSVGPRGRERKVKVCIPARWGMLFLSTTNVGSDDATAQADAQRLGTDPTVEAYQQHKNKIQESIDQALYAADDGSMQRRYQPVKTDSLVVLFPVLELSGRLLQCRTAMYMCEKMLFRERGVVLVMPCTFEHALADWEGCIFVILQEYVRRALPQGCLKGKALLLGVEGRKVIVKAMQQLLLPPEPPLFESCVPPPAPSSAAPPVTPPPASLFAHAVDECLGASAAKKFLLDINVTHLRRTSEGKKLWHFGVALYQLKKIPAYEQWFALTTLFQGILWMPITVEVIQQVLNLPEKPAASLIREMIKQNGYRNAHTCANKAEAESLNRIAPQRKVGTKWYTFDAAFEVICLGLLCTLDYTTQRKVAAVFGQLDRSTLHDHEFFNGQVTARGLRPMHLTLERARAKASSANSPPKAKVSVVPAESARMQQQLDSPLSAHQPLPTLDSPLPPPDEPTGMEAPGPSMSRPSSGLGESGPRGGAPLMLMSSHMSTRDDGAPLSSQESAMQLHVDRGTAPVPMELARVEWAPSPAASARARKRTREDTHASLEPTRCALAARSVGIEPSAPANQLQPHTPASSAQLLDATLASIPDLPTTTTTTTRATSSYDPCLLSPSNNAAHDAAAPATSSISRPPSFVFPSYCSEPQTPLSYFAQGAMMQHENSFMSQGDVYLNEDWCTPDLPLLPPASPSHFGNAPASTAPSSFLCGDEPSIMGFH